jgi:hypothetical protein
MATILSTLFPTADELLAVPPQDLAASLLKLVRHHLGGGMFWPDALLEQRIMPGVPDNTGYPHYKNANVAAHVHGCEGRG